MLSSRDFSERRRRRIPDEKKQNDQTSAAPSQQQGSRSPSTASRVGLTTAARSPDYNQRTFYAEADGRTLESIENEIESIPLDSMRT